MILTAALTALVLTMLAVTVGIMVVEFVKGWRATKRRPLREISRKGEVPGRGPVPTRPPPPSSLRPVSREAWMGEGRRRWR